MRVDWKEKRWQNNRLDCIVFSEYFQWVNMSQGWIFSTKLWRRPTFILENSLWGQVKDWYTMCQWIKGWCSIQLTVSLKRSSGEVLEFMTFYHISFLLLWNFTMLLVTVVYPAGDCIYPIYLQTLRWFSFIEC